MQLNLSIIFFISYVCGGGFFVFALFKWSFNNVSYKAFHDPTIFHMRFTCFFFEFCKAGEQFYYSFVHMSNYCPTPLSFPIDM